MKADALFIIMAVIFIFVAWVATGGPTRPIATAGPFITPVTRSGEESQGYHSLAPSNPINTSSYPKQIAGTTTISSGKDLYTRTGAASTSGVYLEHSTIGPASGNPDQEYVSIVNTGAASVSVTGWKIVSKATGSVVVVPTLVLKPNQKIAIVTGNSSANQLPSLCTQASPCIFLNHNLELYGASHETITLANASGVAVDSFSY